MKKLNLDKQEKDLIESAIEHWQREGLISRDIAEALSDNCETNGFDWKRLAQYSFWVALSCIVLSILSLFIDPELIQWIKKLYDTPDILISAFCGALALLFFYLGFRNKKKFPEKHFSSETLMAFAVFSTAASLGFMGKILGRYTDHFSIIILISVVIYGILASKLSSKIIWIFAMISLGVWFATETSYHSNWGFRFWGMNYPLRFTIFGLGLTLFALKLQTKWKKLEQFQSLTYIIGLLYLFIALWLLSIFGNYSDLNKWSEIKQFHILYWGIISTFTATITAWYGLKYKDNIAREIGVTFFFINIYTRFFEYLWDSINRALFFSLLAISFWFIGRKAEKIWNMKFLKEKD